MASLQHSHHHDWAGSTYSKLKWKKKNGERGAGSVLNLRGGMSSRWGRNVHCSHLLLHWATEEQELLVCPSEVKWPHSKFPWLLMCNNTTALELGLIWFMGCTRVTAQQQKWTHEWGYFRHVCNNVGTETSLRCTVRQKILNRAVRIFIKPSN